MHKKNTLIVFLCLSGIVQVLAQNTLGLLTIEPERISEGYNLLYPHNQPNVYLIDNCGRIVNIWEDENVVPGNSAYLTVDGNLIKCKRRTTSAVNDPIWAGGGGESIEIRTWDNDLIASYFSNDSLFRMHHDIAPLPDGNVLFVSWEAKSFEESVQAGRDPLTLAQNKLWPEAIFEWDPTMDSIVWEWHVWDHLIQDFDATKDNFGVVEAHPELVDINYDEHDGHPDWLHINAIDYNPELDQIILSVPYFNEFWILDHSTSTEEASSHQGGTSNKGGDLLFRWGNPKTYDRNDSSVQQLFFQHDVHWSRSNASPGDAHFGEIVLFNNRVAPDRSTVNTLTLPWDETSKNYRIDAIIEFSKTLEHPGMDPRSVSSSVSSAQLLPNDNMLVCAGRWGFNYEVTPSQELAWEYITPFNRGQRGVQGDTSLAINANLTFRIKRYSTDYAGFNGLDLLPGEYIEINPDTSFCEQLTVPTETVDFDRIKLFPNPAFDELFLDGLKGQPSIQFFDVLGHTKLRIEEHRADQAIDVSALASGLYYVRIEDYGTVKFIKQ